MKTFIISLNTPVAKEQTDLLLGTLLDTKSDTQVEIFRASTPETWKEDLRLIDRLEHWNWPEIPGQTVSDMASGITKSGYAAKDQEKVKACSASHIRLWQKCLDLDEPILILESDALFTRTFDYGAEHLHNSSWGVLGLNDPRGATRKADIFFQSLFKNAPGVYNPPIVDQPGDVPLANGLAGNSAYIIRPLAAGRLLSGLEQYGIWPNDAYICRELWPGMVKVCFPFYTRVQRGASSTKG